MRQQPLFALVLAIASIAASVATQAEELGGYDGPQLYKRLCSSCHGPAGAGDGPVAASFKTKLPDLTGLAARRGGQFPAERIRSLIDGRNTPTPHGARDMPVWGADLRAADADSDIVLTRLVEYLRSLQKPGKP